MRSTKAPPVPAALLQRLWLTQSIPHRLSVLTYLNPRARTELLDQPPVRAILRAAALEADQNVRELALGVLATRQDPELVPLALAQLTDADPTAWEPADPAALRQGVQRWKEWWALSRSNSAWGFTLPSAAPPPARPLRVCEFSLPDLAGQTVRLSQFRGRVVLLNFWMTDGPWPPASTARSCRPTCSWTQKDMCDGVSWARVRPPPGTR